MDHAPLHASLETICMRFAILAAFDLLNLPYLDWVDGVVGEETSESESRGLHQTL
jgi:hypothetical protein